MTAPVVQMEKGQRLSVKPALWKRAKIRLEYSIDRPLQRVVMAPVLPVTSSHNVSRPLTMRVQDKLIIVTGSGGGFGEGIATQPDAVFKPRATRKAIYD